MNILVTGCHGFVGHHVALALMADGHAVFGVDRLKGANSPKGERVAAMKAAGLRYVEGDLADAEATHAMFRHKFDAVVHLAGQYAIKHTRETAGRYVMNNCVAGVNVMQAALESGCPRVIYVSTVVAKGYLKNTSLYGATKGFVEEAAWVYARMGLETVNIKLSPCYGPMMRPDCGTFRVMSMVRDGKPIPKMTGFSRKFELVHVRDVTEAMRRLVAVPFPEKFAGTMVLAADEPLADYGDVAIEAGKRFGREPVFYPEYEITPRARRPDLSALKGLLDWTPPTGLEAGMEDTAAWMGAGR